MAVKVGINGYGRIGRNILRALYESGRQNELQIVGINDLCDAQANAHLTRYDTAHGKFPGKVSVEGDSMIVNGDRIKVTNLHKVFWPKRKLTKGDLFRYYVRVAPSLLPFFPKREIKSRDEVRDITKAQRAGEAGMEAAISMIRESRISRARISSISVMSMSPSSRNRWICLPDCG
jgi:Xaa-Pro aminopeptidase